MDRTVPPGNSALKSLLVIGSSGQLGSIISKKLSESGFEIIGLDVKPPVSGSTINFLRADVTKPESLDDLSKFSFDAVVITVPQDAAEAAVDNIIVPYGKNSLVIDFLSEKYFFRRLLNTKAEQTEHIGIHPLFAPSLLWEKQNVLVTPEDINDERARSFIREIETWGAIVRYCDPLEHDRLMGVVQVGVHVAVIAYTQFLINQGLNFELLDKISTPASRIIWAMAARLIGNSPSVYWEIQAHNAAAEKARKEMADSVRQLDEMVRTGDKNSFDEIFIRLREMFGENFQKYRKIGDEISGHQPNGG